MWQTLAPNPPPLAVCFCSVFLLPSLKKMALESQSCSWWPTYCQGQWSVPRSQGQRCGGPRRAGCGLCSFPHCSRAQWQLAGDTWLLGTTLGHTSRPQGPPVWENRIHMSDWLCVSPGSAGSSDQASLLICYPKWLTPIALAASGRRLGSPEISKLEPSFSFPSPVFKDLSCSLLALYGEISSSCVWDPGWLRAQFLFKLTYVVLEQDTSPQ